MPDARRIAIATADESRATTIGDLVVRAGLVEGWRWYETPAALAVAVIDGARPLAAVIDHLSRAETLEACRAMRSVVRRLPVIAAWNGDHDPATGLQLDGGPVGIWIPRSHLLRDLVPMLELYLRR